jgi:L-fucono-1,5-lactonase
MQIDAHQHFWKYNAEEFKWMRLDWPIRKDYLPADLQPLLQRCGIGGSVAVQARQSIAETQWLLDLASRHDFVLGVVGWIDVCSDKIEVSLDKFKGHSKLVGIRHVVQDEPDDDFTLRPDFQRGIAALAGYDLTYDILIFPRQLPAAIQLAERFPNQPFVLDHMAKPPIADKEISPWREGIERLARSSNVFCKLSGFLTEANWQAWQQQDFRPYFNTVLDAFGPHRLMFGSDWPVALLAGSYHDTFSLVQQYIGHLSATEQAAVMGGNAARFYHLPYLQ